ncbi:hypothetical protein [Enterococcus casseliflavus]|uniref:hypothetical protein n=1 Tax=Enterococcus casseliflavus TaxID=37734 RepID=UPI0034D32FE6
MEIKIRSVEKEVSSLLTKQAKEKGFNSREDYLRYILTKLATQDYQFESDVRYQLLVKQHQELTEWTIRQVSGATSMLLQEK